MFLCRYTLPKAVETSPSHAESQRSSRKQGTCIVVLFDQPIHNKERGVIFSNNEKRGAGVQKIKHIFARVVELHVCIGQELKILMARFPDVGKHLWAMSREAFNPKSRHYEGNNWKARTVDEFETRRLVQAALRDAAAEFGVENECRFFRVFGYLTRLGETWNMFNLNVLENFDPGLRVLPHGMTAHWVQLAARSATKPIPLQPGPVALLRKDDHGNAMSLAVAGSTSPFGNDLTVRLSAGGLDFHESIKWTDFCWIIMSLEFEKQAQSKSRAVEKAEPEKFKQLTRSEISQLYQVQLQLSCGCGIVEVEGAIDPMDVEILATLLGHQLTHLQLVELNDFEIQSKKVAESLSASHEIFILLVTKTGRLHQLVKKHCLNLQRQFPRQLRVILSFA